MSLCAVFRFCLCLCVCVFVSPLGVGPCQGRGCNSAQKTPKGRAFRSSARPSKAKHAITHRVEYPPSVCSLNISQHLWRRVTKL
jgi:hypothetical protein